MIGWIYIFKIVYIVLFWLAVIFPLFFFISLYFSKHRKRILLLMLPLASFILCNACTWSGYHYRMELRDRFGKDEHGNINIRYMPPEIRTEYDDNDKHPRLRDCKAALIWGLFALPLYCLILSPFYLLMPVIFRKCLDFSADSM